MIARQAVNRGQATAPATKGLAGPDASDAPGLGTVGHLTLFGCAVAAVMLTPAPRLPWAAGACLLAGLLIYPAAFRSLLRPRRLIMIALLVLPSIFLVGEADRSLGGIPYSSEGLLAAQQIALRIMVVLVAAQALTGAVDIPSVAGLLERFGLRGLGFSVGVALNLLPALHQSALNAWRSMRMRGGLRRNRLRSLRLLGITIMAGALSRAEEIALAAEARAFSPERARGLPVKVGKWDWTVVGVSLVFVLVCGVVFRLAW